jgi:Flp pilus assembly CpaF family ATPase
VAVDPGVRSSPQGMITAEAVCELKIALPDVVAMQCRQPSLEGTGARHWSINARKFVVKAAHLDDLVTLGTLTPMAARFLEGAVVSGLNVLV